MNAALRRLPRVAVFLRESTTVQTAKLLPPQLPQLLRHYGAKADVPNLVAEVQPGKVGEIPSILDQATGLERAEIDHPDLFKHNEVLRGPFGTTENPVMIQSAYDSRIVGCTGKASPDDHDLAWLLVKKGEQCICGECGQVFELDPL